MLAALKYHLTETRPAETVRLILMSWVTFSGCAAHDFHNAMKWVCACILPTPPSCATRGLSWLRSEVPVSS